MCINCNLVAPLKHYVCDLLGLEKNMYGTAAMYYDSLTFALLDIGNDGPWKSGIGDKLLVYLEENGQIEGLKTAILEEDGGPKGCATDNRVINFAFAKYFYRDGEPVEDGFLEKLNIPVELLTLDTVEDSTRYKPVIYRVKYTQKEAIPRSKLKRFCYTEEDFVKNAARYGIKLLEEPFVDDSEQESLPPQPVPKPKDAMWYVKVASIYTTVAVSTLYPIKVIARVFRRLLMRRQ